MEFKNENRKSIGELIKESESKGMQLVFIDAGSEVGRYAETVMRMLAEEDVMVVQIATLPEQDQMHLGSMEKKPIPEKDFFKGLSDQLIERVLELKCLNEDELVNIEINKNESKQSKALPISKPSKGFKSNHKQMFRGHRKH